MDNISFSKCITNNTPQQERYSDSVGALLFLHNIREREEIIHVGGVNNAGRRRERRGSTGVVEERAGWLDADGREAKYDDNEPGGMTSVYGHVERCYRGSHKREDE